MKIDKFEIGLNYPKKDCEICGEKTKKDYDYACDACKQALKEIILNHRNIKINKEDGKEIN